MGQVSSKFDRISTGAFVAAAILLLPVRHAVAADLLGLYVGGAFGQAHVKTTGQLVVDLDGVHDLTGRFDQTHSAFKVLAGIRPLPALGAEVAYMDFEHSSGTFNVYPANVSMRGESAFGVLYLPVPVVDVFIKAGVARLHGDIAGTSVNGPYCPPGSPCPLWVAVGPFRLNRTNTGPALGAGAQYKFGPLAVRAEYERFSAAGTHPDLVSIGLAWSF